MGPGMESLDVVSRNATRVRRTGMDGSNLTHETSIRSVLLRVTRLDERRYETEITRADGVTYHVKGVGHMSPLEDPDEVSERIFRALEKVRGSAAS